MISVFYSFLFAGLVCAVGQVILDNTKLTPGHITSLFAFLGSFLSFLGVYDFFLEKTGAGARILITNFGHALYSSAIEGYFSDGFLGLFSKMLVNSSLVITSTIIFSFIFAYIFDPKE